MDTFLKKVYDVNPHKSPHQVLRKTLKLAEETGEASQAILSVTSDLNRKGLTQEDYLEEVSDVLLVGLDILFTRFEGEEHLTYEELEEKRMKIIDRKLKKWAAVIEEVGEAYFKSGTTN